MQNAEFDLNPFYYLDDDHDDYDRGHESRRIDSKSSMFAYTYDMSEIFEKLIGHGLCLDEYSNAKSAMSPDNFISSVNKKDESSDCDASFNDEGHISGLHTIRENSRDYS